MFDLTELRIYFFAFVRNSREVGCLGLIIKVRILQFYVFEYFLNE